jgi:hypothetical protein
VKNKFQFISLSQVGGKAKFTMMLPFGGAHLSLEAAMRERLLADIRAAAAEPGKQFESMGVGRVSQYGAQPAQIEFDSVDELLPKPEDYYYKDYRAISATLAPCYGLDFSKPGVLEAAVPMLKGQTVYKDHWFYSVDGWVGVVSETAWDAKGDQVGGGIAGINAKLKLDSKKDPMLIRGVAMEPPAIHSCSVTVLFEFEFSHPDLVEQGRFWQLLGEEVDGQVVRLIVTLILGFWELSLVFQGAQEENKQVPALPSIPGDVEIDDDEAELGQRDRRRMGASPQANSEGRTTVKLTAEQKAKLGISVEGEEVEDRLVLSAVDGLAARAAAGDTLTAARRAECLRVATLAECGNEEGAQLDPTLAKLINGAQGDDLEGLVTLYTKKAAAHFTATCQKCGTTGLQARSSFENAEEMERAGGVKQTPATVAPNGIF